MSNAYVEKLRDESTVYGEFIYQISRFYSDFHKESAGLDGFYVHDSSAVAYVLAPQLFKVKQGPIRVVCEGPAIGLALCKTAEKAFPVDEWHDKPTQQICVDVDSQGLLDLYFKTLCS